jgi:hypothetical protein
MKSTTPEMARFNDALRQIMTVTKPELTAMLHDDKAIEAVRQRKGPKPKTSASGRASRGKDYKGVVPTLPVNSS